MINPKIKVGCGVLTVFGLGFGLGVISLLFIFVKVIPLSEGWKTAESKAFVANHLAKQLNLTDEQRETFYPIVDRVLDRRWNLRRDYLLEDRRMMEEEFLPEVQELLNEEQRARAKQLLERWRRDQRFKIEPKTPADESEPAETESDQPG